MSANRLYSDHNRRFEANRFVYPVLSRRSGGISIGINLNPSKACNFGCVYCQVDRQNESQVRFVDIGQLLDELRGMLALVLGAELFHAEKFRDTPEPLRRLADVAFSGDGEPTTFKNLDEVVAACGDVISRHSQQPVPMVLITNASMLHRESVQRALEILDAHHGEIWAKLDAGTEAYFQKVNVAPCTLAKILQNITDAARARPIVIQSLFLRIADEPPPDDEILAYCQRLDDIVQNAGKIKYVQIHSVARPPAEPYVTALTNAEIDTIVDTVRDRTQLEVRAYYAV